MNTTQTTSFSPNEILYATRQLRRAIDSFKSGRIGEPRARQRVAELRAKYGALLPQPTNAPQPDPDAGTWGISLCDDCGQPQSPDGCGCPQYIGGLPNPDQGPANDPPTCPGCGNQLTDGVCEYCPGICPGCGNHDCDCLLAHHPGEGICGCCGESGGCDCPPHPDERPVAYCPYCNYKGILKSPKHKTCGDPTCRKRAQYCTANPQS